MTNVRTRTIAALLAALSVTTVFAVPAIAEDRGGRGHDHRVEARNMPGPAGRGETVRGGGMGLLAFACVDDAADRLQNRLGNFAERLELTPEQTTLYDAFSAKALTAQTSFADACAAAEPATAAGTAEAATMPDLVERMKARLAVDEARVAALTSVVPELEAFWTTLTAEQKAGLVPERRGDDRRMGERHDNRGPGGRTPRPDTRGPVPPMGG